jgi:hypothetical protein
MSDTTLKLPYKRYVAQVSTGAPRSKSTYLSLMAENLAELKECPWRAASDVPVALTDHDFTASTYFSDANDAFKMSGNYDAKAMTEVAYAGMAAYRFKIPASAASVAISSVALPVSRDRFLKGGVRVAAVLSNSSSPSMDWNVVRGADGAHADAQLAQDAAYLLAGSAGSDTVSLDAATHATLAETGYAYLWVYLTLEDYTDAWEMYSAKEKRLYAIEGSAMLVGGSAEVTFAGDVSADAEPDAAYAVYGGVALPEAGDGPAGIVVERQFTGDPLPEPKVVSGADGVKLLQGADAFKSGVALADSVAGLRMAYAALLSGAASPVPPAAHAMRPGARFLLEAATAALHAEESDVEVGVWRISASALAVPFAAPTTFTPRRVRLEWGACAQPVTQGLVWRVWLKQGTASPAMPALADAAFWTPGSDAADGYSLVGGVEASSSAGFAELPISLTAPLATILVTAFLPADGIAVSAGMSTSFGCAAEFKPAITLK